MAGYDYVVVGAGSAGCVVARRLVEGGASVLLLEAGGSDRQLKVRMPAAFSKLFRTAVDWGLESRPEPQLGGRRLFMPRGKLLGGSSSINAMLYVRGNPADYEGWAAGGCPGWSWPEVLPYFLKAEDNSRGPSALHGVGGPLSVSDQRSINPLSVAFLEACRMAGIAANRDFNGPSQAGYGPFQVTQRRGRRVNAAEAYLRPLGRGSRLTVATGAHALRVLFEGDRATGVAYLDGRQERAAWAAAEVIVAAGAFGSPQLLLLSGVGPEAELRRHRIPLVAELAAVGEHLQDHPFAPLVYACRQAVSLASAESLPNLLRFLLAGRGPLTSPVAEAGAFLSSSASPQRPDLQLHFAPSYYVDHGFGNPPGHGFSVATTLLAPHSRGRLRLASADPLVPPEITSRTLIDERDLETLVEGLAAAREICGQQAFEPYRGEELCPGPAAIDGSELRRAVRRTVDLLYHPVGTCRMGIGDDAVVDPELRVRGVRALRVVDASIMPRIPRGNTHAPTVMIGERASAMILAA